MLRDAGVTWHPRNGDAFVIDADELDHQVFYLSDLTVEVQEFMTGPVLGFNGTTEWALDSFSQDQALWLPREDQLRELLGGAFSSLERVGAGFVVYLDDGRSVTASDPVHAYAEAVLQLGR